MKFLTDFFQRRKLRESAQEFSLKPSVNTSRYKRDILPRGRLTSISQLIHMELKSALKERQTGELQGLLNKGDRLVSKYFITRHPRLAPRTEVFEVIFGRRHRRPGHPRLFLSAI